MYYLSSGAGNGVRKNGIAKRGSRLSLNQRFLHLIEPLKWRDRLITASTTGRMFTTHERVVSIEPDGVEDVYGLETTTGNYVVWGLASSNSSQFQQAPVPRGEGIFKREWWQLWEAPDNKFPLLDYVVASLDGAFTEDEENDPSALTVWGVWSRPTVAGGNVDELTGQVWHGQGTERRIMLVHAWRKHLQFSAPRLERLEQETTIDGQRWLPDAVVPGMSPEEIAQRNARYRRRTMKSWGLVEWVHDTCVRFKVDKLLIEAKASGISAAQEIRNRFGAQRFGIELCPVKGDKVARALAVQPTFSQGLVYAPDMDWADMVISEAETFPKGKFKDLTDSMTQALKHLRDGGLAQTDEEAILEDRQAALLPTRQKALYPV